MLNLDGDGLQQQTESFQSDPEQIRTPSSVQHHTCQLAWQTLAPSH